MRKAEINAANVALTEASGTLESCTA